MMSTLETFANQIGVSVQVIVICGVALGVTLLFFGVVSIFRDRNIAADRIAETNSRSMARQDRGLLRGPEYDPRGLIKTFVPTDEKQRGDLQRKLSQAGYPGTRALVNFFIVRMFLGVILPGTFLALIMASRVPGALPPGLASIGQLSNSKVLIYLSLLVAGGYYLPLIWLNGRSQERSQRIELAFPNALDLMQISVEAGLGFDAAMTRVGNELATVSPDISFEFLTVQRQVQAGRERDRAMQDMANRTGVETVRSFASVVQQSMQFGTSMSEALNTYSKEMRDYREMKAQEMANKLPVKMSAVLALLMLPALILLTLGPVIIRYQALF